MRRSESAMQWPLLLAGESEFRPLAHVAVRDEGLRRQVTRALRRMGFAVVESKSGYHLLSHLAEPLFAEKVWMKPRLIVVDAFSPGCSGLTIAQGLADLGETTDVILLARDSEQLARIGGCTGALATSPEVALAVIESVAKGILRSQQSVATECGEESTASGPAFSLVSPSRPTA